MFLGGQCGGGGGVGVGGEASWFRVAVELQSTGFVLKVVSINELVQEVDGRALGFGVLDPEVPQVGSCVAR